MNATPEPALVQQAQGGNLTALGTLYDQHYQPIFRFIWSRVKDQATAEDLTGELFVRMVYSLPDYRADGTPFRAWLYRIARNLVTDHHRKYGRHEALDLTQTAVTSVSEEDPMQLIDMKLTAESVQQALARIDPAQREVVELRFLAGLSLQEVADTLDKTVAAVKALQHRGLSTLRLLLRSQELES